MRPALRVGNRRSSGLGQHSTVYLMLKPAEVSVSCLEIFLQARYNLCDTVCVSGRVPLPLLPFLYAALVTQTVFLSLSVPSLPHPHPHPSITMAKWVLCSHTYRIWSNFWGSAETYFNSHALCLPWHALLASCSAES